MEMHFSFEVTRFNSILFHINVIIRRYFMRFMKEKTQGLSLIIAINLLLTKNSL